MKKEFIAELSVNPIWMGIVEEIKNKFPVCDYNPNDPKRSAVEQTDRWKFVSGQKAEFKRICQILNIEV